MLPSAPKSLGRLSDVFQAAFDSINGTSNALGLKPVDSAIVLMVDGLGFHNLKEAGGHARFLNMALGASKAISTVFPSTTAAALTSFASGLQPSQHGFVGYRILDRGRNQSQNLLSGWSDFQSSRGWREGDTVSDRARNSAVKVSFIGPAAYARSGFTNVIMPGADYVPAQSLEERITRAIEIVKNPNQLVYLYVPELDQAAHAKGAKSQFWLDRVEVLDAQVRRLNEVLGRRTGLLVTADHGIVDVRPGAQIELAELQLPSLSFVGGDTRAAYLYLESSRQFESVRASLEAALQDTCWVVGLDDLVGANWMQPPSEVAAQRLPDLFVLAKKSVAVYHREFSSPKSYAMVGHHGSITTEELAVPLLKLGAWF